jgi:RHS repeat-associated protein
VVVAATDPSGNTRTNTYELGQAGASTTFTYDANGNLIGDGSKTYEWDANNRLIAVKQGGSTLASFTYGGGGRRSTKTAGGVTTTYVYDGLQFLEERPGVGSTKRYVYGPGIDQEFAQVSSGAASYNVADHLGSVVRVTDSAGAPILSREYDPWGTLLQGSTAPGYAYTGREWDPESGLYYYRARYYDSKVGRFISQDPIGFRAGLNFYAYVGSSPVNYSDPLGLFLYGQHLGMTAEAMTAEGFSGAEARALARGVANVDRREGTQDPSRAHEHAMREKTNPRMSDYEAERRYREYVDQATKSCDHAAAIHAIQDSYSRGHCGFQEWGGGMPSASHMDADNAQRGSPEWRNSVEATRRYIRAHLRKKRQ